MCITVLQTRCSFHGVSTVKGGIFQLNKVHIILLANFSLVIGIANLIISFVLTEYSNIRLLMHIFSLGILTGIILFIIMLGGLKQ